MKIIGNRRARRGHGVPSRYWSPLGVPEHFVGGWERLYKAFHGSWYIAVAFTCCFIRGHLDNISLSRKTCPKKSQKSYRFLLPAPSPPTLLVLHSRRRTSLLAFLFNFRLFRRTQFLGFREFRPIETSFSRAFLLSFLAAIVGYGYTRKK